MSDILMVAEDKKLRQGSLIKMPNEDRSRQQEQDLRSHGGKTISDFLDKNALNYSEIAYSDGIKFQRAIKRSARQPIAIAPRIALKSIPIISCFTGAGGFDVGAEVAGFRTILAIDIDKHSCATLRFNKAADVVIGPPDAIGDLHKISPSDIIRAANISTPFPGVIVGGPPCQPFSIAANQRFNKSGNNFKRLGFKDKKRGSLIDRFEAILIALKPAAFVLENVRGLMELDGGKRVEAFCEKLAANGYGIFGPTILNAKDFGVPQYRERLFVVGNRLGRKFLLSPSPLMKSQNVADALANLPDDAANHSPRDHAIASILRYRALEFGQREKLGRVDRLHPLRPSKTVIAGGTNGGGRSHLHPFIPRTLTVRECARLQTFPDSYVFSGPIARQFTQVGNAIPPLMAYHITASLYKSVFD